MFNDLAEGATVATGSVRRRAQLAARRPDLQFIELRGNIHTRLGKVPEHGAIVMAMAALEVLGISDELAAATAVDAMAVEVMVPQVGQGAVAVECATGDVDTLGRLASVDDEPTRLAVECERAFLAELGSGCSLPVAAYAVVDEPDGLRMRTFLAGPEGIYEGVHEGTSVDAAQWAAEAAGFARRAVGA